MKRFLGILILFFGLCCGTFAQSSGERILLIGDSMLDGLCRRQRTLSAHVHLVWSDDATLGNDEGHDVSDCKGTSHAHRVQLRVERPGLLRPATPRGIRERHHCDVRQGAVCVGGADHAARCEGQWHRRHHPTQHGRKTLFRHNEGEPRARQRRNTPHLCLSSTVDGQDCGLDESQRLSDKAQQTDKEIHASQLRNAQS